MSKQLEDATNDPDHRVLPFTIIGHIEGGATMTQQRVRSNMSIPESVNHTGRQRAPGPVRSAKDVTGAVSAPRLGATLVEMAFVAPVFFMVVLGIIEFGRAMMVSQLVTNAAREGARSAAIDGSSNSSVTQRIQDFLQNGADVDPADVSITITVDNPDAGDEVANAERGDECTINVQVPFDQVQYIAGDYLTGVNLVGEATMRHE